MSYRVLSFRVAVCLGLAFAVNAPAYDYEAHRSINQLALATLPKEFPGFVKTAKAAERIAFLAGEPDRWRNTPDLTLKHLNAPDHYFDIEDLAPLGLSLDRLPPLRYQFTMQLAEARLKHQATLAPIDPDHNPDHTRELVGFLPWSIAEGFAKLKSAFSYLKAYQEAGTTDEIANAQADVIYYMGVMGHFVGDAAQPLHTTRHFNGWVGDNPHGYTTSKGFHSWIDGGYLAKVPVDVAALRDRLKSAKPIRSISEAEADPSMFAEALQFVRNQHKLVEPLYELDKEGKLSPNRRQGQEGRSFFEQQFLTAAQELGSLWYSAWREAQSDSYLKSYLSRRRNQR